MERVKEFLIGWIKGTKDLLGYAEAILEIAENSRDIKEFEKKAKDYLKNVSPWFREELQALIDNAIAEFKE